MITRLGALGGRGGQSDAPSVLVDRLVAAVLSVAIVLLAADSLDPEGFGEFSLIVATTVVLTPVLSLGLLGTVVDAIARQPGSARSIALETMVLRLALGLAVGLCFVALVLAGVIGSAYWPLVLAPLAISATAPFQYFEGTRTLPRLAKIRIWASGCALLLALSCWLKSVDQAWFAITYLSSYLIAGGIAWVAVLREAKGVSAVTNSLHLVRSSLPLLVSSFAVVLNLKIDQFMLARFGGTAELAPYALSAQLADGALFVPATIAVMAAPVLSRSHHAGDEELYQGSLDGMFRSLRISGVILYGVTVLVGCSLALFFLGGTYTEVILILPIYAFGSYWLGIRQGVSKQLIAEGFLVGSVYSNYSALAANVSLNFLLIPVLGGVGAALATVASYFLSGAVLAFFPRGRCAGLRAVGLDRRSRRVAARNSRRTL